MTEKTGSYEGAGDSSSRALAPSETTETTGRSTVGCTRCGQEAEPSGKGQCVACGCWLPANEGALIHGGRRMQTGKASPLDEAHRVAIRDAVLEDLGGDDQVGEVMRQLVEDFAGAVVLRDLSFSHLAAVGPLTLKGRRRAVVGLYMEASARAERLATRIGTDRKPARVPSLQEYLNNKPADDESQGGADA